MAAAASTSTMVTTAAGNWRWSLLLVLAAIVGLRLDTSSTNSAVSAAPMRGARELGTGCPRGAPDLSDCVGTYVQQFVNFMSSGKLTPRHWITPFDPLHLPNMTIFQRKDMQTKALYVNRYLVGLKNTLIQDVKVDLDKLEFNVTALLPSLEVLGMFSSAGRESDLLTENSIRTFSLRNTVIDLVGKGSIYTPTGSQSPHQQLLWLQFDIHYMSIASYVMSDHFGTEPTRPPIDEIPPMDEDYWVSDSADSNGSSGASGSSSSNSNTSGSGHRSLITPARFMKLMEKDLRVQLIRRLQYIANEALQLAPFGQLFPV
ncbi:uncharacterized protein LOC125952890 [Anopheles darlingi]|uniref:uncharacterized protein LOC125952890 n=1 Tax=Anopheles darlingi TaxID=43151 RepID=UPI0021004016|nr:uncharacterized protein LOC125952890 [Anopheles darlingi]